MLEERKFNTDPSIEKEEITTKGGDGSENPSPETPDAGAVPDPPTAETPEAEQASAGADPATVDLTELERPGGSGSAGEAEPEPEPEPEPVQEAEAEPPAEP